MCFCGSLYPELREPGFALALFSALNDPDVTLTMAGGGWERFTEAADTAAATLSKRLVRPGLLPLRKPPRWKTALMCW